METGIYHRLNCLYQRAVLYEVCFVHQPVFVVHGHSKSHILFSEIESRKLDINNSSADVLATHLLTWPFH